MSVEGRRTDSKDKDRYISISIKRAGRMNGDAEV